MRLRDHYDWIVLGDDPGALLSASLVAHLGLSVLVLPLAPRTGAELKIRIREDRSGEDVLDFESNYSLGLSDGGLWCETLRKAGMTEQEEKLVIPNEMQILTPAARISLSSNRERLSAEFEREYGKEIWERTGFAGAMEAADPAIEGFWSEFPERLTLKSQVKNSDESEAAGGLGKAKALQSKALQGKAVQRGSAEGAKATPRLRALTLEKLADQTAKTLSGRSGSGSREWFSREVSIERWADPVGRRGFLELLEGVGSGLTGSQGSGEMKAFELLNLLALSRSGASFRGGMTAFREFLLKLARRNGADLPERMECRQIFTQSGRFVGVLPSVRGSMIGATGAILGIPFQFVSPIITQSGQSWLRNFKSAENAVGWKFTLSLRLHPEAIPPGMSRRLVWQENGAPFFEMEYVKPNEYGVRDRDEVILFLRTLMPISPESLTLGYQRMVAARMLRKATEIAPFLEYHIRRIFPDFRNEEGRELQEIYQFSSVGEIPPRLLCFQGMGPGAQSGVEGLFLCSSESFPRMGMHGSVVAALEGAAWVAHRSGLSGPFKAH